MKALVIGIVVSQNINIIRVKFGDIEKQYILSTKFPMRPTFEDDAEIIAAITNYDQKLKDLDSLKKKLASI